MPISDYLKNLRAKVGNDLLVVPSVTAILFDDRERVLLARHSSGGVWVTPGGSVDPDETPSDAIVREVWEETGLLVEPIRVLGVYGGTEFQVTYGNGDRVAYVASAFEVRRLGGVERPDGEETLELGYFSEKDLEALFLPAWARVVLPDVFRDRGCAHFQTPRWKPEA